MASYIRLSGSALTVVVAHDRDGNGLFTGTNERVDVDTPSIPETDLGQVAVDASGSVATVYRYAGGEVRVAYDRSGDGDFDDVVGGQPEIQSISNAAAPTAICLGIGFDTSQRLAVLWGTFSSSTGVRLLRDLDSDGSLFGGGRNPAGGDRRLRPDFVRPGHRRRRTLRGVLAGQLRDASRARSQRRRRFRRHRRERGGHGNDVDARGRLERDRCDGRDAHPGLRGPGPLMERRALRHPSFRSRTLLLALLAISGAALSASSCGPDLALGIPANGALLDETPVAIRGRVRRAIDFASLELRLDGVDLVSALGLVPPFVGAGGVVDVNGELVTVSGFDFDTTVPGNPVLLEAVLSGLSNGPHALELAGTNAGMPLMASTAFELVAGFEQAAQVLGAAGLPSGPGVAGSEGVLVNATLGQPIAGPRIPLAAGDELRPGFEEAAEARISAGLP